MCTEAGSVEPVSEAEQHVVHAAHYMNTNQIHFNVPFAAGTAEFGAPLVVSSLTLAIVLGLSVADTSENAAANLGWGDIRLPKPVFAGDTRCGRSRGDPHRA